MGASPALMGFVLLTVLSLCLLPESVLAITRHYKFNVRTCIAYMALDLCFNLSGGYCLELLTNCQN